MKAESQENVFIVPQVNHVKQFPSSIGNTPVRVAPECIQACSSPVCTSLI